MEALSPVTVLKDPESFGGKEIQALAIRQARLFFHTNLGSRSPTWLHSFRSRETLNRCGFWMYCRMVRRYKLEVPLPGDSLFGPIWLMDEPIAYGSVEETGNQMWARRLYTVAFSHALAECIIAWFQRKEIWTSLSLPTQAECLRDLLLKSLSLCQDQLEGLPACLDGFVTLAQLESWANSVDVSQFGFGISGEPRVAYELIWHASWFITGEGKEREVLHNNELLRAFALWMLTLDRSALGEEMFRIARRDALRIVHELDLPNTDECGFPLRMVDHEQNALELACSLVRAIAEYVPGYWIRLALWISAYSCRHPMRKLFGCPRF